MGPRAGPPPRGERRGQKKFAPSNRSGRTGKNHMSAVPPEFPPPREGTQRPVTGAPVGDYLSPPRLRGDLSTPSVRASHRPAPLWDERASTSPLQRHLGVLYADFPRLSRRFFGFPQGLGIVRKGAWGLFLCITNDANRSMDGYDNIIRIAPLRVFYLQYRFSRFQCCYLDLAVGCNGIFNLYTVASGGDPCFSIFIWH